MFVPLWDMNPVKRVRFQFVTVGLILANCIVFFFFQTGLLYPIDDSVLISFAVIPNELIQQNFLNQPVASIPVGAVTVPEGMTLVTYMFLHGSFMHLLGNMIFLWVFGDNVEDAMGHVRFIFFYFICGIFAGLAHAAISPQSNIPMIGASGAVAGVISAYLMLHPNVRLWVLALYRIPLPVSAAFALIIWIGLQFISALVDSDGGTAWWAHIGGLAAGALLILFMRKPGVPLFDRATGLEPRT